MYAGRRFKLHTAVLWTHRVFWFTAAWSTLTVSAFVFLDVTWLQLPGTPLTIMGTAVSFYLGFKGNAAYGRLWEARKIWGGIVNSSRTWGIQVTTLVSDLHLDEDPATPLDHVHRELIYRHVAWLGALRTQLRRPKPWEHLEPENAAAREGYRTLDMSDAVLRSRIEGLVSDDELAWLMDRKNKATQLVSVQARRLKELFADGRIEDFRHMVMVTLLEEFYTLQGKAERIKNFPLPRQYATVNHWFVKLFILMLPLGLMGPFNELGPHRIWLTIPTTMVLGWVFYIWDMVLDYSENPFEGLVNDIPMDSMSRGIEIDLREMLGETDLPPPIGAVNDTVM